MLKGVASHPSNYSPRNLAMDCFLLHKVNSKVISSEALGDTTEWALWGKKMCSFMALVDLLRVTLSPWSVLRNLSEITKQEVGEKRKQFFSSTSATWNQPGDGGDQEQQSLPRFTSRKLTKDGERRQDRGVCSKEIAAWLCSFVCHMWGQGGTEGMTGQLWFCFIQSFNVTARVSFKDG